MKKNIIMIIIILICSMSLLLVMYNFATKDIYYISENINNKNIELSMTKIENGITTTITETPVSGFYDISYECENNNATLYWSNSTYKLKVKVTNSPVKCSITFREINNDLNLMAIYVDGTEVTTLTTGIIYTLDYTNTKCYDSNNTVVSNTVDFDPETNKISVSNVSKKVYCNLYLNTASTLLSSKILSDNTIAAGDRPNLSTKAGFNDLTTGSIYWTSTNTENVCKSTDITYVSGSGANAVCKSYYFAGNTTNNFVEFAGYLWRIIRINEDGSVRLLYSGTRGGITGSSRAGAAYTWYNVPYNYSSNDNTYVGWYNGTVGATTYDLTHSDTFSNNFLLNNILIWIQNNLYPDFTSYLSTTAIFCNDRSLSTTTPNGGYGKLATYYGAAGRLTENSTASPQFKCPQARDRFTYSTTSWNGQANYANGKLNNILRLGALITADEAVYAGGFYTELTNDNYLKHYDSWASCFTMTPAGFQNGSAYMFRYNAPTGISTATTITHRLVINLKGCTLYNKGSGTSTDPYQVTISGTCKAALN